MIEPDHLSDRLPRLAAGVVLALGVLVGCGQHTTAGQAAPEVKSALAQVENALAGHRYPVARRALNTLTLHTLAARHSGALTAEQADRILAAAARLEADLPPAAPTASTSPSGDPGATDAGDEDSRKGDGDEQKRDHGHKHD